MSPRRLAGLGLVLPGLLLGLSGCPEEPAPRPPVPVAPSPTPVSPQPEAAPDADAAAATDAGASREAAGDPTDAAGLDLGPFRVGFSADEERLAYLSQAPGSTTPLFTVVSLPGGRRVTDFLLLTPADQERARRLLDAGGYPESLSRCPAAPVQKLLVRDGVWELELGEGAAVAPGLVGKHFQEALRALSGGKPERLGCSRRGRWAAFGLGGGPGEAAWPRSVIALSFVSAPPTSPEEEAPAEAARPPAVAPGD